MSPAIRDALIAYLRKLEWSGEGQRYDDNSRAKVCPVCHERQPYKVDQGSWVAHRGGHDAMCELNVLITALERAE